MPSTANAPTQVIGDDIRARLSAIDAELADAEGKIKPLRDERTALQRSLKEIEKLFGGPGASSTNGHVEEEITLERILGAVGEAPAKTPEIASRLGVKPNKIARKLRKLADDGKVKGDKDAGFSLA